jgi:hypothetical protein
LVRKRKKQLEVVLIWWQGSWDFSVLDSVWIFLLEISKNMGVLLSQCQYYCKVTFSMLLTSEKKE